MKFIKKINEEEVKKCSECGGTDIDENGICKSCGASVTMLGATGGEIGTLDQVMKDSVNKENIQKSYIIEKSVKLKQKDKDIILEKNDKFIILKEQSSESESLANQILKDFEDNLKDSNIKVILIGDDSIKTDVKNYTKLVFKAIPRIEDEYLNDIDLDFSPEFDNLIKQIFSKHDFEEIQTDEIDTFWVEKFEGEEEDWFNSEEEFEPILSERQKRILDSKKYLKK